MPEKLRPLEFSEGFVGPPVPRTKTGAGCPEWQNLALTPEGTSLMPMPGWRRTYPYPLRYKPFVGLLDVAGVRSTGDITFSGQPSVADTITIGDAPQAQIYEFFAHEGTYSGSNIGVEMGEELAGTLFSLSDAIKDSDTVGVSPLVNVTAQTVTLTADLAGVKGDLIGLAKSGANITVDAHLDGGADEQFAYTWYDTVEALTASGDTAIEGAYLVVVFPPQALLTNGGQGLGIVDQATGRIAALAFHPGGVALNAPETAKDRTPRIVGHLNRQGAHDCPKLLPCKGLTFVITPWDEIRVWDGAELRLAGIRAPQTAPGLEISDYEQATTEGVWAGNVADPTPPVGVSDMNQSTGRTDLRFRSSNELIRVVLPYSENSLGEMCYANGEQDAADSQMVIAVDVEYHDNRASGHHKTLPAGTLALVVGKSEATGAIGQGTGTLTYPIEQELEHGKTYRVELPFTEEWSTLQAFGWRLEKKIPDGHYTGDGLPNPEDDLDFCFKLIYKAVVGQGLLAAGEYLIGFSWFDRKRMRESNVSPFGKITLGAEGPVAIDLSGLRDGMIQGQENTNPDPRHVDAVRVYLHRSDWGTDSYGYPQMRLYQEFDAPQPDEFGRLWVYISGERDINDVAVDKEPEYEMGILPPSGAAVVDGDRLILGNQPSYSVGRVYNPMVSQTMYKARAWKTSEGLICYANTTANPTGKTFQASTFVADWYHNTSDATEHVWCASNPSDLTWVEYPDATPEFGPWLEGREIRFGDSGDKFLITKALMNGSGEYDRLWVYRLEIDGSYGTFAGPWNEVVPYEITGQPNRMSWSVILPTAPYIEGMAQAGYQDIEMPGDEILALGAVGDFLVAIGRKMTVFLRQMSGVVDGSPEAGNPFPGPRAVRGGTVSGRSLVEIGSRRALYFSPEGKLMLAGVEGVEEHPLSARFMGWITSQYRIDPNMLGKCHAVWEPVRNLYVLFLADSGIGPAGVDASDKRNDHPDGPPLDRYIGWAAPS